MLDLPLRATRGPVLPLPQARALGQAVDQDKAPQAHQAHQALVPDPAVVIGFKLDLQHSPRPVDARDLSTQEQLQMEASKSFLQMRQWPVVVRRMY